MDIIRIQKRISLLQNVENHSSTLQVNKLQNTLLSEWCAVSGQIFHAELSKWAGYFFRDLVRFLRIY